MRDGCFESTKATLRNRILEDKGTYSGFPSRLVHKRGGLRNTG